MSHFQESEVGHSFLLSSQNKSLCLELARSKRSISEARKELLIMRRKTMEMQSLVSLIQRTWSQVLNFTFVEFWNFNVVNS